MNEIVSLSPPARFNILIERLFDDVRTRATNPWFPLALAELTVIKVIWRRLRRMQRRFASIVAQYRAGTLAEVGSGPRRPAVARPAGSPRPQGLSQRLGWVIYAVSWFVWGRHYDLEEMLEEPDAAMMVADAPQLGGVLRPLCRMLHVRPPVWLRRPRKPRPSRKVVHPPAPEFMMNDPAAIIKADGSIWMRFGASTNWRKPDLLWDSLEEAQKYDKPQRIWPPVK